jgi:hypothetical protein
MDESGPQNSLNVEYQIFAIHKRRLFQTRPMIGSFLDPETQFYGPRDLRFTLIPVRTNDGRAAYSKELLSVILGNLVVSIHKAV